LAAVFSSARGGAWQLELAALVFFIAGLLRVGGAQDRASG
jgi:hypothetical protein